jgi:hypothetical protein
MGSYQSGKLKPVAVFTQERLSIWRKRVERYLRLMSILLKNSSLPTYPGIIYQVDQTRGELKDSLDIYDEFPELLSGFQLGQDRFLR